MFSKLALFPTIIESKFRTSKLTWYSFRFYSQFLRHFIESLLANIQVITITEYFCFSLFILVFILTNRPPAYFFLSFLARSLSSLRVGVLQLVVAQVPRQVGANSPIHHYDDDCSKKIGHFKKMYFLIWKMVKLFR